MNFVAKSLFSDDIKSLLKHINFVAKSHFLHMNFVAKKETFSGGDFTRR